jgi:hypothetical protein
MGEYLGIKAAELGKDLFPMGFKQGELGRGDLDPCSAAALADTQISEAQTVEVGFCLLGDGELLGRKRLALLDTGGKTGIGRLVVGK